MFGLHVHVGVPSGDKAIGAINMLVQYIPHLIALSSNSPFWQGVDTGLASSRIALYRLLPHAGLPQYFVNWKEFRGYCKVMKDCHTIASFKDIYWDIRPRPERIRAWASETGLLDCQAEVIDLPPWHYGLVFNRRAVELA